MRLIAIVNYGMGNIDSVKRAVEECGGQAVVTADAHDFQVCQGIILPGVGAFTAGMKNLRQKGLDEILTSQVISNHIPVLGICLGMQLMAKVGLEGGRSLGLGWIDAEVRHIKPNFEELKIPHVGWNGVLHRKPSRLWQGIPSGQDFYFTHSYSMVCVDQSDVLAVADYGGEIVAAVEKENVMGVQFHPEKSLSAGLTLIGNFIKCC